MSALRDPRLTRALLGLVGLACLALAIAVALQDHYLLGWLALSLSTLSWYLFAGPAAVLARELSNLRIRKKRLPHVSEAALSLGLVLAAQTTATTTEEVYELAGRHGEKWVAGALIELERAGLVRHYEFAGEPRYAPHAAAAVFIELELARRQAVLEAPGPRPGPRSRASALAERT